MRVTDIHRALLPIEIIVGKNCLFADMFSQAKEVKSTHFVHVGRFTTAKQLEC